MIFLLYDGSFEGFLTCVFESGKISDAQVSIRAGKEFEPDLFSDKVLRIRKDETKYTHVIDGIRKKMSSGIFAIIFHAFLSERKGMEDVLLAFIRRGLLIGKQIIKEIHKEDIRKVLQAARRTKYECHRFLGLLRFEEQSQAFLYAPINPDNNIIQLLGEHFKQRFPHMNWIINDVKRKSALVYFKGTLCFVPRFERGREMKHMPLPENQWQTLWKLYCRTITVPQRKNSKLQQHFIPKKYRDILTEMKTSGE